MKTEIFEIILKYSEKKIGNFWNFENFKILNFEICLLFFFILEFRIFFDNFEILWNFWMIN